MSFDRPEDNKRIKVDTEKPHVLYRVPTAYISFDVIKDSVLKEAEGRRLVVEKDGELEEYLLDGSGDVVYLTREEFANPDITVSICTPNRRNPFEFITGKRIDWVDMYSDKFYKKQRLAMQTYIGSYSCEMPLNVFLYYDDGAVMIDATPSERLIKKFSGEIMDKGPHSWTDKDIEYMASMKPLWGMRTLKTVNIFAPQTEEEFAEQHPEAYGRILEAEAKIKAEIKNKKAEKGI